jgi:hypothetical protein
MKMANNLCGQKKKLKKVLWFFLSRKNCFFEKKQQKTFMTFSVRGAAIAMPSPSPYRPGILRAFAASPGFLACPAALARLVLGQAGFSEGLVRRYKCRK